jgi:Flp pilus assembly protein TadD
VDSQVNNPFVQAEALFFDGNKRMAAGDNKGAEDHFRLALMLVPNFPEAMTNLALLRERAGSFDEAEFWYRKALTLSPDILGIHLNLGSMLLKRKRLAETEAIQRHAVRLAPQSPEAWSGLGVLLAFVQQEEEAEACYRTALALDPQFRRAAFNLSYLLLRQGRWEEGWLRMEARDHYDYLGRHFTFPRWNGEALAGKTLVIGTEGGHGDMVQFGRYATILKDLGARRITVIAHPGAVTLMHSIAGVDDVLPLNREVAVSGWDFWTPAMSQPLVFNTRPDTVPAPIPYLHAAPERVKYWAGRLPPPSAGLRVGLSWKGNPNFENDEDRSLPSLATLAPLADIEGVHFVSLQKGPGEAEALRPPAGMTLLPLGAALDDFADTAALLANMDLVISVDTAIAHMSGAMGIACWTLLPDFRCDWRWLTQRTDTPWYPAMRLFRQPAGGGWDPVIAAVADALRTWKTDAVARA